jgi:hypothetical protein
LCADFSWYVCKRTLLPRRAENKRRTDVGHIPDEIGAQ